MKNLGKTLLINLSVALLLVLGMALAVRATDPSYNLDFNGDGKTDIAVYDMTCTLDTEDSYYRYKNSANGQTVSFHWGSSCFTPVPADYFGDGTTDYAAFKATDEYFNVLNQWWIYGHPNGYWAFGTPGQFVPRDYDGDDEAQPAVFRLEHYENDPEDPDDDTFSYNYLFRAGGEGFDSQLAGYGYWNALFSQIAAPGDYAGFGYSQIAVFDLNGREFWIYSEPYTTENNTPSSVVELDIDRPAPGDYDGDSRTDFAGVDFNDTETGIVYIWRVKFNSNVSHPADLAITWGVEGDKIVPGDYDGDGKTDIAVFRPGNHTWYIRRSSDSGTTTQDFGESDDIPVPLPVQNSPFYP